MSSTRKREVKKFIHYFKDERFIEWKLFNSEEMNEYWQDYLLEYPEEIKNFELAEKYFDHIRISHIKLQYEKKKEAVSRLELSLKNYQLRLKIRHLVYIAAACAAVLLLSVFYIHLDLKRSENEIYTLTDYIRGSELESEEILFITSNKTISFQNNVDIQIDGGENAFIRSEQEKEEVISIEKNSNNKLIVPYGKRSKIILSDGTHVWLNSGSSLEFPSNFSENTREVILSGEMYIEVTQDKDRLFYVNTSNYNVKVHGTSFNVSSYPGSVSSVVLVKGNISLQSSNKDEMALSPFERATYLNNDTFQIEKVDVAQFISWKDGYLTFDDTPITQVIEQIERYYNLSFNYGGEISLQGITCTGKIILSDNLDNVLTTLSLISSTVYKRDEKFIYMYVK